MDWSEIRGAQGLILGPLLFLLFINGIPTIVNSNVMLFADGTKIWRIIENNNDILALQKDLNTDKCKHMAVTSGEVMEKVYNLGKRDSGIIFDKWLEFDKHIDK